MRGLSSESCLDDEEGNEDGRQEHQRRESSAVGEAENLQQRNYDEDLANEKLTTEDIHFVIATMK